MDETGIVAEGQGSSDTGDVAPQGDPPRGNEILRLLSSPPLRRSLDRTAGIKHEDADSLVVVNYLGDFDQNLAGLARGKHPMNPSQSPMDQVEQFNVDVGRSASIVR